MSKEAHDWLKRQVDLYDMIMPGRVQPPKPGTPEHYKWIQETYFGGKPPLKPEDEDND